MTVKGRSFLCSNFKFTYKINNLGRIYKINKRGQENEKKNLAITMDTALPAVILRRPVLNEP